MKKLKLEYMKKEHKVNFTVYIDWSEIRDIFALNGIDEEKTTDILIDIEKKQEEIVKILY